MFTLTIELGNEAMQNGEDVADALERVAQNLRGDFTDRGTVRDANGNKVGEWLVVDAV